MNNVIALDVGEQRVGVAIARAGLRIAMPLVTLTRPADDFWEQLTGLLQEHQITQVVVGLPRGLDGQETAQTTLTRNFAEQLQATCHVSVVWQDEALTSVKAEETLKASKKPYTKADIDAVAASLILNDYLQSYKVVA